MVNDLIDFSSNPTKIYWSILWTTQMHYSDHNHTMFISLNLCHQGPVVVPFPSRTTLTDNLQHAKTQFWTKIIHTANSDIDHFSVCNYCFFFQFKDIYWQMTWYSLLKPCGKLDMPCGAYSECNYQLKLLWMCVAVHLCRVVSYYHFIATCISAGNKA